MKKPASAPNTDEAIILLPPLLSPKSTHDTAQISTRTVRQKVVCADTRTSVPRCCRGAAHPPQDAFSRSVLNDQPTQSSHRLCSSAGVGTEGHALRHGIRAKHPCCPAPSRPCAAVRW